MKSKKLLAMLLALGMTLSVVGCGSGNTTQETKPKQTTTKEATADTKTNAGSTQEDTQAPGSAIDMEGEPYTVAIQVVTLPGVEYEGEADREAAINAITEPAINCRVDIQQVWISELGKKTSMAVVGGEKMDLIHVGTVQPLSAMVGSDMLYDMNTDDLLKNHGQDIIKLVGEELISTGEVSGKQLAVPTRVYNASSRGVSYNKDIADQYGIVIPETATLDEFEKCLYALKDAGADVMPFFMGSGELNYLQFMVGYDGFGSEASYGAILDVEKEMKVENLYASEMFKDYCLRMYKWKQDGLIAGDSTDSNTAQSYFGAKQLFAMPFQICERLKAENSSKYPFELGWTSFVESKITSQNVTEYMWGISTNSERPDKAMDFLNYIYTNGEVANILKYGQEGVNYEFAEGSEKVIVANGTYAPAFLVVGNEETMHILSPAKEDYIDKTKAFEASASVSPILGYMFDDTIFQTESSLIKTTIKEYLPRLQNGMCESEEATLALLDEFVKTLETSGINEVIAANQEQLEAFLAEKGN